MRNIPLTPLDNQNTMNGYPSSSVNVNDPIEEEEDSEIRGKIWGPYYKIALTTLQIFPIDESASKGRQFLNFVPNLVVVILLLARGIFMLVKMSSAPPLSLYWAYSGILFFLSLHGLIGSLALLVYKKEKYFDVTIDMIRTAAKNTITSCGKRKFILFGLIYVYVMLPSIYIIIENFVMYDHDVTDIVNLNHTYHNITGNLTAGFRKSLFGHRQLYFLDAILIILGAYCAANALIIYLLANKALCREYEKFNEELKTSVENGTILRLPVIKAFESQLIDYMKMARFITNVASFLIDVTFMAALFIQISSQFALKSFSSDMKGIQIGLFSVWTFESICFLVLSTKKPASFSGLLIETSAMLWLDHGIWSKCDDPAIREIARSISQRIDSVDYASKNLSPIKSANLVFNIVLFIIPFFVDILGGNKFVPWFLDYHQ